MNCQGSIYWNLVVNPVGAEMNLPLANGKYRKPAGILARLLGFSGLALWIFHLYVFLQYNATRPRQFDTSSGRIYAENNHGHVVYLTKTEDTTLTALAVIAFSLLGAGALTVSLFGDNIGWSKRPAPWEKKQW